MNQRSSPRSRPQAECDAVARDWRPHRKRTGELWRAPGFRTQKLLPLLVMQRVLPQPRGVLLNLEFLPTGLAAERVVHVPGLCADQMNNFQLPLTLRHDLLSAGSAVLPVAVEWVPTRPRGGRPASRDRHRHTASSRAPHSTRIGRSRPAGAAARGVPRGNRPGKPHGITIEAALPRVCHRGSARGGCFG